jgi:hypothetical protein
MILLNMNYTLYLGTRLEALGQGKINYVPLGSTIPNPFLKEGDFKYRNCGDTPHPMSSS